MPIKVAQFLQHKYFYVKGDIYIIRKKQNFGCKHELRWKYLFLLIPNSWSCPFWKEEGEQG